MDQFQADQERKHFNREQLSTMYQPVATFDVLVHDERTNIDLLQEDLNTLNGTNWVNDAVIDVYLSLITQSSACAPHTSALPTLFYQKLSQRATVSESFESARCFVRSIPIFECNQILIPVHVPGHWILITVCGLRSGSPQLRLYDPKYFERFEDVMERLITFFQMEFEVIHEEKCLLQFSCEVVKDIPAQENG